MQSAQSLITYLIYYPYQPLYEKSSLLLIPKYIYKSDYYSLLPNFEIFNHNCNTHNYNNTLDNFSNIKEKINFAIYNIRGFNNQVKHQQQIIYCLQKNFHIISITETKLKDLPRHLLSIPAIRSSLLIILQHQINKEKQVLEQH